MDWHRRLDDLTPQEFRRTYRMAPETFDFILEKIRHLLVGPDEARARLIAERFGMEYIEPELKFRL